ncbi:hypothetical protein, partial [Gelidibacter salicanalis]|uniref:hypothetical protein n=1 Tax=Gelidibacter salicanalis TaxID=291193 RepID=UPI001F24A2DE
MTQYVHDTVVHTYSTVPTVLLPLPPHRCTSACCSTYVQCNVQRAYSSRYQSSKQYANLNPPSSATAIPH